MEEFIPPDPGSKSGIGRGGPESIHQLVESCPNLFWLRHVRFDEPGWIVS
jgi:hypothetical protein